MTMLDETKPKPNGRAEPVTRVWDARLTRIEQRLAALPAEVHETGEQRVLILRDALADFAAAELAKRDKEIVSLQNQLADLQQKLEQQAAIDQRVHEIFARLEEKQEQRDRGKNGIGDFIQTMGTLITQERQSARAEFKAAVEEAQRAVEAKLAALEQRLKAVPQAEQQANNQRWAVIDQRIRHLEQEMDGRLGSSAVQDTQCAIESKLEALEQRLKAVPGKLPVAKTWRPETVVYQAEFVSHEGALWQAKEDTAQAPGGADWVCVARAGRDGTDAPALNICGTYDARKTYRHLDVVALDGASFVAKRDDPGICTGDGWQLLCRQGKRGKRGERGPVGPKGDQGEPVMPQLISSKIDENYNLVILRKDNSLEILPLREAFERYDEETRP
jgi:hypothetical protein